MAYVERWWTEFESLGGNVTWAVRILEDGFGGSTTAIENLAKEPLRFRQRGTKEELLGSSVGGEIEFSFIKTPEDGTLFDDLFIADERQFLVEVEKDAVLFFSGWVRPENMSKPFVDRRVPIKLSVTDNLAVLKGEPYVDDVGDNYTDVTNVLTIIKRCLEKTGHELDFDIRLGYNHFSGGLMAYDACALDEAEVDNERFLSYSDGLWQPEKCADVLGYCLVAFNCHIRQLNGRWYIGNNWEVSSRVFRFDWATLTEQSKPITSTYLDIDGYDLKTLGTETKRRPQKTLDITFQNKYVEDNLLPNGDFHLDPATGWNNPAIPPTDDGFDIFTWSPTLKYVTCVVNQSLDEFSRRIFYDDIPVIQLTPDDSMHVSMDLILHPVFPPVTRGCQVFVDVENQTTFQKRTFLLGYASESWTFMEAGAAASIIGTADYRITVRIEMLWPSDIAWTVSINNVKFWVEYEDASFTVDKVYRYQNVDIIEDLSKGHTVKFADSKYAQDEGALKIGGTLTDEWRNYQGSQDENLLDIVAEEYLRARQSFYNYRTIRVSDPNDNINPATAIHLDGANHRIIRYNKKARKGDVDLDIVEIKSSGGLTILRKIWNKDTIDGAGGGGGGGTSGGTADSVEWTGVLNTPDTLLGYGIEGTKSEFNTALTDGTFMFVGDAPTAHTHTFASLTSKPTTIAGYGITNAYTKSEVYTQTEADNLFKPDFSENTGFNKNFGTIAGTVSEGNHTHAIDDLSDVNTSGLGAAGELMYWDGGDWINQFPSEIGLLLDDAALNDLDDVDTSAGVVDGSMLYYKSDGTPFWESTNNFLNLTSTKFSLGSAYDLYVNSGKLRNDNETATQIWLANEMTLMSTGGFRFMDSELKLEAITAPTNDTATLGKIYHDISDGLVYWRNEGGTTFDLTAAGGSATLAGLSDTNVSGMENYGTLHWQGSDWVNSNEVKISSLGLSIGGAIPVVTTPLLVDLTATTDSAALGTFSVFQETATGIKLHNTDGNIQLSAGNNTAADDANLILFDRDATEKGGFLLRGGKPTTDVVTGDSYIQGAYSISGTPTNADGGNVFIDGGVKATGGTDGNVLIAKTIGRALFGENGDDTYPSIAFAGASNLGRYGWNYNSGDITMSLNAVKRYTWAAGSFIPHGTTVDLGLTATYWRNLFINPQTAATVNGDHFLMLNATSKEVTYWNTTGTPSGSNFLRGDGVWAVPSAGAGALSDLTDVTSAAQTDHFVLMSIGGNYLGRALATDDIPDLSGTYLTGNESISLTGDLSGSGTTTINATIQSDSVTLDMMVDTTISSVVLGRMGAAGTVAQVTVATLTANLSTFSTSTTAQGVVAGSNGATTLFLRGDGTWAAPTIADNITGDITAGQIAFASATDVIGGTQWFTYDQFLTESSGVGIALRIQPEVDQTSTAGYTVIHIDVNEDTTGSGERNFMKLYNDTSLQGRIDMAGVITMKDYNISTAPSAPTFSTAKILLRGTSGNIEQIAAAGASTGRFLKDDGTFAVPVGTGLGGTVDTDEVGYGLSSGILTSSPNYTWDDTELSLKVDTGSGLTSMLRLQKTRSGSAGATGDGVGINMYLEDAQSDIENVANIYGFWQNTVGPYGGLKFEVYDSTSQVVEEIFSTYLAGNPYYIFGNVTAGGTQLARLQAATGGTTMFIQGGNTGGDGGVLITSGSVTDAGTDHVAVLTSGDFQAQTTTKTGTVLAVWAYLENRTSTGIVKVLDVAVDTAGSTPISKFWVEGDGDLWIADQPTTGNVSDRILMWDATGEIRSIAGSSYGTGTMSSWNVQANGGGASAVSQAEEVNFLNGNFTTAVHVNQTNPTITFNHNTAGTIGAGTYGNTANGTKIDTITVDAYGHITAVVTGATGSGAMSQWHVQGNGGTQIDVSNNEEVNFIDGSAIDVVVVNQTNPTVQLNLDINGLTADLDPDYTAFAMVIEDAGTFRKATLEDVTVGVALSAENVNVLQSTASANRYFVFATTGTAGSKAIYTDSAATCYINPSTNAIGATFFVGALTGNASSCTVNDTSSATEYRIVGATGNSHYSTGGITYNASTDNITAAKFNTYATSVATAGSTIAVRDASQDITCRLIRQTYSSTNATTAYFITQVNTSSDNYHRPSTADQVIAYLDSRTWNFSGTVKHTGGSLRMNSNINLYFGTSAGGDGIVDHTGTHWYFNQTAEGNLYFRDDGTNEFTFDLSGAGTGDGTANDWIATSDVRLKDNIKPLESWRDRVVKLGEYGVTYERKKDLGTTRIGWIAQEVKPIIPEYVTFNEGTELYGINYAKMVTPLYQVVGENIVMLDKHEGEIGRLKKRVKELETKIERYGTN